MAEARKVPEDIKREAFHLSLAVEELIYDYPDRIAMAAFVALAAAFQNLAERVAEEDALPLFAAYLKTVTDPQFALEADDPATRGYVMPAHETVQ